MMQSRPRFHSLIAAAALAIGLCACTPSIDQRGNLPDPERLADVKPGQTTKEMVIQLLGSPSVVSSFDKNTWLYVSARTQSVAFLKTQVLDQETYEVTFDDKGIVLDLRRHGMEEARAITPVERTTPAPGHEMGVIEQLVGNFGRFNPLAASGGAGRTPGGGSPP